MKTILTLSILFASYQSFGFEQEAEASWAEDDQATWYEENWYSDEDQSQEEDVQLVQYNPINPKWNPHNSRYGVANFGLTFTRCTPQMYSRVQKPGMVNAPGVGGFKDERYWVKRENGVLVCAKKSN